MFILSTLLVHPYGGVDKNYKLKNIQQRAKAQNTVFDSNVIYPKIGFKPELLSDDILSVFNKIYKNNERFKPDIDVFKNYLNSLLKCQSCNVYYPNSRKNCPNCSTINVTTNVKVPPIVQQGNIKSEVIFKSKGNIVFHQISNKSIFVIVEESNKHIFYKLEENKIISKHELQENYFNYGVFQKYLVCYKDRIVKFIDTDTWKDSSYRPVDLYQGQAVFDCSANNLYYLYDGSLMKGNFQYSNFVSSNVNSFAKQNTWVSCSKTSEHLVGFYKIYGMNRLFNIKFTNNNAHTHYIDLKLKDNESFFDQAVYFCNNFVLFYLKTEIKGKTFNRMYLIHENKIIHESVNPSLSHIIYETIQGKAFFYNGKDIIILHATDDGLYKEIVNTTQSITKIQNTEMINKESFIYPHLSGLLCINDNEILSVDMH